MKWHVTSVIFILVAFSQAYAIDDNESVYINGVTYYNILIASTPVLVDNVDYQQAYFDVISIPYARGEYFIYDINRYATINISKVNETIAILLKDNKMIIEDKQIGPYTTMVFFRFKDHLNYDYYIEPYGVIVVYTIPVGKKLTVDEFIREKIKFLNESTNKLRKLGINWMLDLEDDYKCAYCDFTSGQSYTHIVEISKEDNDTYAKIIGDDNFGTIKSRHGATIIFRNEPKSEIMADIISVGESQPDILKWYSFLAYSKYNRDKMKKINKELDDVSESLQNISSSLTHELNSTEAIYIFKMLSISDNDTIKQDLSKILRDINSVDYFIKISKEIKNRPHSEWLDIIFGDLIDENINRSKEVRNLYDRYNALEEESKNLFDITVAVYSAALQREGIAKQLEESWKMTEMQVIYAIFGAIFINGVISFLIQWYFNKQQKKQEE